jgi:hypothetical protein
MERYARKLREWLTATDEAILDFRRVSVCRSNMQERLQGCLLELLHGAERSLEKGAFRGECC